MARRPGAAAEPPAKRARAPEAAPEAAPAPPRGWSESSAAKAAWGALPVGHPPHQRGGGERGAAAGAAEAPGGVAACSPPCVAPCWAALRGAARAELRELLEAHRFEAEARRTSEP